MQVLIFALAFAEERFYVPAMGPMTPLVAGLPAPVVVGNLPYPRLPGDEVKRASVDSTSITAGGIIVMLAVGAAITKRPAGRPSRGRALRMEEGRDTAVFREEGQEEEDEDDFAAPIRKLNVQYDEHFPVSKTFWETVTIPADKEAEYLALMDDVIRGSRDEDGCYRFDVIKGEEVDGGCKYHMYSVYGARGIEENTWKALAENANTEHFKAWKEWKAANEAVGASSTILKSTGYKNLTSYCPVAFQPDGGPPREWVIAVVGEDGSEGTPFLNAIKKSKALYGTQKEYYKDYLPGGKMNQTVEKLD